MLKQKKTRLLGWRKAKQPGRKTPWRFTAADGGLLVQETDRKGWTAPNAGPSPGSLGESGRSSSSPGRWSSVKSNAIVLAKDRRTVGIAPGSEPGGRGGIAIRQAASIGAVLASNAFPMKDTVEAAAGRITYQPGSIRDESIARADRHGISWCSRGSPFQA